VAVTRGLIRGVHAAPARGWVISDPVQAAVPGTGEPAAGRRSVGSASVRARPHPRRGKAWDQPGTGSGSFSIPRRPATSRTGGRPWLLPRGSPTRPLPLAKDGPAARTCGTRTGQPQEPRREPTAATSGLATHPESRQQEHSTTCSSGGSGIRNKSRGLGRGKAPLAEPKQPMVGLGRFMLDHDVARQADRSDPPA